ncbi:MAG: LysM domain-containing protein [Desulfosarcinaceae bacterium]|nr:LysM domain-containing protein [Desulfosarcinaceae bacterium]
MLLTVPAASATEPNKTVEHEAGLYYTIQKGDTLWDLSQHFNDTPWMWPELWKENDQIPNPHWIYPGERIRLYHKSDLDRMQMFKKMVSKPKAPAATPVTVDEPSAFFRFSAMDQVGFIRKAPLESSGTIFRVQDDQRMVSEGDTIYIKPPAHLKQEYVLGSKYTVYRTLKPVDTKDAVETFGTQYYLLGVVEIIQNHPQYSLARIIRSFRDIKIKDQLMPYQSRAIDLNLMPGVEGLESAVITSEEHTNIMGDNTIAFIDKGARENVYPGQQYMLYNQEEVALEPGSTETIRLAPEYIGTLLVLHTEETTATVLITSAQRQVEPGQKLHAVNR